MKPRAIWLGLLLTGAAWGNSPAVESNEARIVMGPARFPEEPGRCGGSSDIERQRQSGRLQEHPAVVLGCQSRAIEVGEDSLEMAICQSDDGRWSASVDFDGNGAVDPGETVDLEGRYPNYSGRLETTIQTWVDGRKWSVPFAIRITNPRGQWCAATSTYREGTLPIEGGVAVGLTASSFHGGWFHKPYSLLSIDADRDGRPDVDNRAATWWMEDAVLSVDGQHWRFWVAPDGSAISLQKADRPAAVPSYHQPLPRFDVVDFDGTRHTNDDYLGKPLVLAFWMGPHTVGRHMQLREAVEARDLNVLCFVTYDSRDNVTKLVHANPLPWPATMDGPKDTNPFANELRVPVSPGYVLVDAKGRLEFIGGLDELLSYLTKHYPDRAKR